MWKNGPAAPGNRGPVESAGPPGLLLRLYACRHRDGSAVGHQHQQGGRRAECPPRDAVVARPAAVLVLDAGQVVRDGLVPLRPLVAALDDQRLTDVQVAEELLAAV